MEKHLTPEKIRLYTQNKLRGRELLDALLHLESCDECHRLLPSVNSPEIVKNLFIDDDDGGILKNR
jgi:hypothetical protein